MVHGDVDGVVDRVDDDGNRGEADRRREHRAFGCGECRVACEGEEFFHGPCGCFTCAVDEEWRDEETREGLPDERVRDFVPDREQPLPPARECLL